MIIKELVLSRVYTLGIISISHTTYIVTYIAKLSLKIFCLLIKKYSIKLLGSCLVQHLLEYNIICFLLHALSANIIIYILCTVYYLKMMQINQYYLLTLYL